MNKGFFKRSYGYCFAPAAALLAALLLIFALCGCAKAAPQLKNGDFESVGADGIPTGWYADCYNGVGSVGVDKDPERGNVLHIVSNEPADARLVYELAVEPNTDYEFTCFVKTEGVQGGAGANIGVLGIAVASQGVFGTCGWQEIKLTGRTAAGQKTVKLSLCLGSHGQLSAGEVWFDGASAALAGKNSTVSVMLGMDEASPAKAENSGFTSFPTNEIIIWTIAGALLIGLLIALHFVLARMPYRAVRRDPVWPILLILLFAFIVRIVLAYVIYGHETDINCFVYWGRRAAEKGVSAFYGQNCTVPLLRGALADKTEALTGVVYKSSWCDYPPGYMLVLGVMYKIGNLLGASRSTYGMLIKLPAIIADVAAAYVVYSYAKRRMSLGASLMLAAVAALTPVFAYISAAWGQIDQVLSLLLVVPILLLYDRKPVLAGLVYGAAIIIKPQALMAGPLFAAAYLLYVFKGNPYNKFRSRRGAAWFTSSDSDSVGLRLLETVLAVAAAFVVILAVALPFKGDHNWGWLLSKYYGTATSYDYATVNAYNFWALVGANWKPTTEPFLGLTYGKWGTLFMAGAVLISIVGYVFAVLRHKSCKGALPLVMAFMFSAIFTFGHYMHERYVFPIFLLLLFAYIFYNDMRILFAYGAYSVTVFLNCLAAFYYADLMKVYKQTYDRSVIFNESIIFWCSLANVAAFLLLAYITIDLIVRNRPYKGYNG